MIAKVVFVCAQNVCRSPLMADSFMRAVDAARSGGAETEEWAIRSGGTHARPGAVPCRVVVELAPATVLHRSSEIGREDVDAAGLVIVASRVERSWIAQLAPDARSRTFTLREALLLDGAVGDKLITDSDSFRAYVSALDAQRGTVEIQVQPSSWWRRHPVHPLDILDVHRLGAKEHRRGLQAVVADAERLGQSISRRWDVTA